MSIIRPTRRESIGLGLGAMTALAAPPLFAATAPTKPVETAAGKVRGLREGGVEKFLGIPYGADTHATRFRPPAPPQSWSGVKDCTAFGAQAVQGVVGGSRPGTNVQLGGSLAQEVMRRFKATMETTPGSEDCLFLNVWTPEASSSRNLPVMVWLHGGGFAIGSGGDAQYEGSALAQRGNVVVTLNHRLNALGYLYLGALDPEFADSGNAGTLDIVAALRWVRDNIGAFGGDPDNVTIFGESGGGAKVSAMLAVPAAQGLFHKAIIQSGPGLKMGDAAVAAQIGEQTLAALGLGKGDVRKLAEMDANAIVRAASEAGAKVPAGPMRTLSPVVDGRTLPAHPFDPTAPAISRDIPIIIGSTKDEATLFTAADPGFGKMSEEEARARFDQVLKDRGPATFAAYKEHYPEDPPTYLFTSLLTQMTTWMDSIRLAELKAAQGGAGVYMYRVDWDLPILDGVLRSPHGTDVPLMFDTTERAPLIMGTDGQAKALAKIMSAAWSNFARTGNPSQPGLAWPVYDAEERRTAIFDTESRIVADPDAPLRRFWA